jgi:3-oxoacyl-[acyl-carrier-protein] synthase II
MTAASMITAYAALSPYGSSAGDFAAGVRAGPVVPAPLDSRRWHAPQTHAALVPGFDVRTAVGTKGVRTMDRISGLAVAAAGMLLGGESLPKPRPRLSGVDGATAVVLGIDTGSVDSMMAFTRSSITAKRPYHVDAAHFPNVVMNRAAAQVAIWHGLRGANATVAGGRVAGLLALNYTRRLHRAGRADAIVCGGVEEFSASRGWLAHHTAPDGTATLAEGCALLLCEPADHARAYGRAELAEVCALAFGVYPHGADVRAALGAVARTALAKAGVSGGDVWAAVTSGGSAAEPEALGDVVTADMTIDPTRLVGDAGAASIPFGLAAAFALAAHAPAAAGRHIVAVAADRDGGLGCAVLRLCLTAGNGAEGNP